ncbi:MAG: hypothetical protein IKM09_01210 [Clostridia bacterium]|nr:hypothetical protein [Clostridia bacterium]
MLKYIKQTLIRSSVTFTILVLAFYLFGYHASAAEQPAMTAKMIFALFAASFLFCASSFILKASKLPRALIYLIHCAFCTLSAFLLYIIVLGNATTPAGKLVCVILTLIIYAIIMGIRAVIISHKED